MIARAVAESRGDVGEVVDVERQHRRRSVERLCPGETVLYEHGKQSSIREPRQCVVVRVKRELILGMADFCDVVPDHDCAEQRAASIEQRLAIDSHRPPPAGRANQHHLGSADGLAS